MNAYRNQICKQRLEALVEDLAILAGDVVGPSDSTWQDVAGTAVVNLYALANQIEQARAGNVIGGPVVFPSPREAMAKL